MKSLVKQRSAAELYALEIKSENPEKLATWYQQTLKLTCLVRLPEDSFYLLDTGGAHLALIQSKEPVVQTAHLTIALEYPLPLLQEISKTLPAGEQREQKNREGFYEIVLHDPEGNRLRLFAFATKHVSSEKSKK